MYLREKVKQGAQQRDGSEKYHLHVCTVRLVFFVLIQLYEE